MSSLQEKNSVLGVNLSDPWKIWTSYLSGRATRYIFGAFFVALAGGMQVLSPRILGWAIDHLKSGEVPAFFIKGDTLETFKFLFLCFVGVHLVLMIARVGWRLTLGRATHQASVELKKKIWTHARYLPERELNEKFTVGHLMNNSTSDVNTARYIFGFTLIGLFDAIFLGVFTFVCMLTINSAMTFWTLGIFILLPFIFYKLTKLEGARFAKAQDFLSRFNEKGSQAVTTIRMQRLTQTGSFWEKKLIESADSYREKRLHALFTTYYFFPFTGVASIICYAILFLMGIHQVLQGNMSIGEFVAFQSLIFIMQNPLSELGFIISEFQRSWTSLSRLCEVYAAPAASYLKSNGRDIENESTIYRLKNLTYIYPEGKKAIINNLDLEIKKGERIGITGAVGSGKSTLLQIMSGLSEGHYGDLIFNGRPMHEYSHLALRQYIAMVPQKTFLFADTIRNNISLNLELTDDEIWHNLELAGVKYDVEQFEDGLDTALGEWGINLSGGQKQRLTLARAIAAKPQILILDDCLSAVDIHTEETILSSLDQHFKETTIIWVAHRLSTLRYCNRIIELES